MVPVARAEARKALELLPAEPNAHAVLGAIAASHDYDWKEAGEQFRQARASEPLSPSVYDLYAMSYLAPLGRFDEAIEQQEKAIAQDPLNMFWRTRKCMLLLYAEMYEPAIIGARKVLEVDDRDFLCHSVIALGNFFQGKLADAREPAEEAFHRASWNAGTVGFLAGLLSLTGEDERARKLLAAMRGITPAGMILYHLVRSETDAAIDWYERGIEQRQPFAAQPAYAGFYKPLRSSPRWPKLARMMNLPETD
jgi:serine/threonine-protein kinase